jgi:starch synthase
MAHVAHTRNVTRCAMRPAARFAAGARATVKSPRILFATSEAAPLIKTGGLADVSAALPRALAGLGCELRIVLPAYAGTVDRLTGVQVVLRGELAGHRFEILEGRVPELPVFWLVRCPALFDRAGSPYLGPDGVDWPDNAERFALFGRVVARLGMRSVAGFRADLVHLNDWQTGIAGALLARATGRPALVFTIHNLQFAGVFEFAWLDRLGLPTDLGRFDSLEFHGRIAFIKGGLAHADVITTVSPGYAREIQTPELGAGLDGLLRHRSADLVGILNGVDTATWNPVTDRLIPVNYGVETLDRKDANKRALQSLLGLPATRAPLVGMVTRLTEQKGIDLVLAALAPLRALGLQIAILGSGAAHFEQSLAAAADVHPGQIAFRRGYDEGLAHLMEAGADLFLMPSRFEPCGLNQLYSMAYGTLPIVRRTGGLGDTVRDAGAPPASDQPAYADSPLGGTGFVFDQPAVDALVDAVARALDWWRLPACWRALQRQAMAQDFSWSASSRRYLDVYERALAHRDRAVSRTPS